MGMVVSACRVCNSESRALFSKLILRKFMVQFFECSSCGHIQTETPYWLQEAYENLSFQNDVGMADRSVGGAYTTVAMAYKTGVLPTDSHVDWGAGTGLLVRLCRDHGMDSRYYDLYASNVFAKGFEANLQDRSQNIVLVTAFEVAEHFPQPIENFAEILALSPRTLLFSTLLYQGQGEGWWYFLSDGQHVALYTRRSLQCLADRFGYNLYSNGCDLHAFTRDRLSDRFLNSIRKKRDVLSLKYRKKFGSRISSDFERMLKTTGGS